MSSLVVVHPDFDGVWPFAADHFRIFWPEADFRRLEHGDARSVGGGVGDARGVRCGGTMGGGGGGAGWRLSLRCSGGGVRSVGGGGVCDRARHAGAESGDAI